MVTTKQQILDIAMNLNRIGNWAADGYDAKQKRILLFLNQTKDYIDTLDHSTIPNRFSLTLQTFIPIFHKMYQEGQSKPKKIDVWAENCMTWGNILTHRASLLT
jgi:hypothetical protein